MGAAHPQSVNKLARGSALQGSVQLTPYLSLVIAIVYMMMADGEISDQETSQLQSITGGDRLVLDRALAYVDQFSVEQYLRDANSLLDDPDRLCVMLNACDSLMVDGTLAEAELTLFDQLLTGFGLSHESFRPYFEVMSAKNRISILGDFNEPATSSTFTPPVIMVIAMMYMMSSDGDISEEEIGRLSITVGSNRSLLKVALGYVGSNKVLQFLPTAADLLDKSQSYCVLLNACDVMMADQEITSSESDLFVRMLTDFGFTTAIFEKNLRTLELKNSFPKDHPSIPAGSVRAPSTRNKERDAHSSGVPAAFIGRQAEGLIFERDLSDEEQQDSIESSRHYEDTPSEGVSALRANQKEMGQKISRTMDDNVGGMKTLMGGIESVDVMRENSSTHLEDDSSIEIKRGGGRDEIEGDGSKIGRLDDGAKGPARRIDDASGEHLSRQLNDAEGISDQRREDRKHGDGAQAKNKKPAQGDSDQRKLKDSQGAGDSRHWKDAEGDSDRRELRDQGAEFDTRSLSDASGPHEIRALNNVDFNVQTERELKAWLSLDDIVLDDEDATVGGDELAKRMALTSRKTRYLHHCVDAMLARKSVPSLTLMAVVPNKQMATQNASNNWALGGSDLLTIASPLPYEPEADPWLTTFDNHRSKIVASHSTNTSSETGLQQSLRRWSLALFPALIIAQGFCSMGESAVEQSYIRYDTLATSAVSVHQMMVVQQALVQISPELDTAADSIANTVSTPQFANTLSERDLAVNFLEQNKQEQMKIAAASQAQSAVSAEKLQWFLVAKSLLMLGLGMTVWGVLFRSKRMLHVSSVAGLVGVLLTINGMGLYVHI